MKVASERAIVIVVDTNVVAYYLVGSEDETIAATAAHYRDSDWVAPPLWRSELRNVLCKHIRARGLSLKAAAGVMERAELMLGGREHPVDSTHVMALALDSGCTTCDCEFVSLALQRQSRVVTADRKVVNAFPEVAIHLNEFSRERR